MIPTFCLCLQFLTRDSAVSSVAASLSQFVSVTVTGLAFMLVPQVGLRHKLESMMSFMCYLPVSTCPHALL